MLVEKISAPFAESGLSPKGKTDVKSVKIDIMEEPKFGLQIHGKLYG